MPRLDQTPDEQLIRRIKDLDTIIRELKVGRQYLEASMYQTASSSAYDISGTLAAAPGANYLLAAFSVVLSANDGVTRFQSQVVPQLFTPDTSTLYEDTLSGPYLIQSGIVPKFGGPSVEHYFVVSSRKATSAQSFYFKYTAFSTTPVIVSAARVM